MQFMKSITHGKTLTVASRHNAYFIAKYFLFFTLLLILGLCTEVYLFVCFYSSCLRW